MSGVLAYGGLFFAAFLAATIFPAQSEALLTGLLLRGGLTPWLLVLVASLGNVLGAVFNWALGRGIGRFQNKKWFPVKEKALARAREWYQRYGRWSLLLSWAPFIGDPLTVAAGIMRERLAVFLIFVGIAKTVRYIALTVTVLALTG